MINDETKIEYVFYSGGFDTTFYLLHCLIDKKVKVQPIIVKVKYIDGKSSRRISEYHESISRKNFYDKFKITYPHLSDNLLDEIIHENETILDNETLEYGREAYLGGIFSRGINQLLYFHQVCKDNGYDGVVVGYTKDDGLDSSFFNDEFILKENHPKSMKWANNLKMPLINLTKKEMLKIAEDNLYDSFLYETWSCWSPKIDNTPCGECELCKITIVDTKLSFPKPIYLI